MSANIDGLLNSGKNALRQGNKIEAQTFFIKVTEIEPHNAEAWLWLAQSVETTDEQTICLENVLVIDPANADAKRQLEELKRGGSISAPLQNNPFGDDNGDDFNTFLEDATTDPFAASSPAPPPDAPFGKPSMEEQRSFDSQPQPGGFDADGPFSSGLNNPAIKNDPVPTRMSSSFFDDTMIDSMEDDKPRDKITHDDVDNMLSNDTSDMYMDDDIEDEFESMVGDSDEAEIDPLDYLPEGIKPTRLPGTDEKVNMGLVTGIGILGVLNLVAVIAIILQFLL